MAIYEVKCKSCQEITELICSYDKAKEAKCLECNGETEIIPSKITGFIINGFCAANNYDNPTKINYDGRDDW